MRGRNFFWALAQRHWIRCLFIQTAYLNSVLKEDGTGPKLTEREMYDRGTTPGPRGTRYFDRGSSCALNIPYPRSLPFFSSRVSRSVVVDLLKHLFGGGRVGLVRPWPRANVYGIQFQRSMIILQRRFGVSAIRRRSTQSLYNAQSHSPREGTGAPCSQSNIVALDVPL